MNTRGAGLAAIGATLVVALSGCGGTAAASDVPAKPNVVDVEAIALAEVAAIDALGYPTEIATWSFEGGFVGTSGGTAEATTPTHGQPTDITLNDDPAAYEQYGSSVEVAIRSTVRHEFGHAIAHAAGYGSSVQDELELRQLCPDPAERRPENTRWGSECIAEAISEVLTAERQGTRVEFYGGTDLSTYSLGSARELLSSVTG